MEKAELIEKINEILSDLQPVLAACKIIVKPLTDSAREKRLERVHVCLEEFRSSQSIDIFKHVEALRSPGVLAMWAADENLRGAREARLYIQAVNLVRATWQELEPLPQFFRRRDSQCRIRTKKQNEKQKLSQEPSLSGDQEIATVEPVCTR